MASVPLPFKDVYEPEQSVAKMLGIKVPTLRLWFRRRQGPPRLKVGRRIFYHRQQLLTWLAKQEQQPVNETNRRRRSKS